MSLAVVGPKNNIWICIKKSLGGAEFQPPLYQEQPVLQQISRECKGANHLPQLINIRATANIQWNLPLADTNGSPLKRNVRLKEILE